MVRLKLGQTFASGLTLINKRLIKKLFIKKVNSVIYYALN